VQVIDHVPVKLPVVAPYNNVAPVFPYFIPRSAFPLPPQSQPFQVPANARVQVVDHLGRVIPLEAGLSIGALNFAG
jgi:hypothetical protein